MLATVITAVVSLAGLGLLLGAGLVLAGRYVAITVDPRIEMVTEALPGANCGACGYAGCAGYASAVVAGTAPLVACPPGGSATSRRVAQILGVAAAEVPDQVAVVACAGGDRTAVRRSRYDGVADCKAADLVGAADKLCPFGCLGLGTCQRACPFDAVIVTPERLAVVDPAKCTGCGKCVPACPRGIIQLAARTRPVHVLCSSTDRAKTVKAYCSVGCTTCKLCSRESKAFDTSTGLARVDATWVGEVPLGPALVCPQGTILDTRLYDPIRYVGDPSCLEDLKGRQAAFKEEQKRRKAEASRGEGGVGGATEGT